MKDTRATFRLTEMQKERLEHQATERDMSISSYLVWLINQDTEAIEKEKIRKAKRIKQIEKA